MIVQCENCETRFHVADARIPEKGARVRCSRCHHRFHITPSSGSSAGPAPEGDVSASADSGGPPAAPAQKAGSEDELDNPEFLFEDGGKSGQAGPGSRPAARTPRPPEPPAQPEPASELERLATRPPEPEPPAAPPTPLEERVVETAGKTAQEMLDLGAPKLSGGKVEFGGPSEDFFGKEDAPATERKAPSAAPAGKSAPALELDAGFGGSLGEEEETDPGWDALTRSEDQPADVFAAGASFGLVKESAAGPAPVTLSERAPLFAEGEASAPDTKKRQAPSVSSFDPEARSPIARIVQIAAFLVGLALLGGALHGLELQRAGNELAPSGEQAAGWIASDVETFVARDSSGQRVLVVRG
ncbi:MAG TPA: zinc-ribbon domain-containing protein, partial [Myxococcota bacterium]|nr:zinc-ribbon domain-containing protein [Myxococcota bacterium]